MRARATSGRRPRYVPALHYRWLTPLYDPVLQLLFRETALKSLLVAWADLRPGQQVLDLGCGTGTLTLLLKRSQPSAVVMGLDGDPDVLSIARRKTVPTGLGIPWNLGLAWALPFRTANLDLVVSCLVLHHLSAEDRVRALHEVARVLRPGGILLVADFGPPRSRLAYALAKASQLLEATEDGVESRLPERFGAAGLERVEVNPHTFLTPMGTIVVYRCRRTPHPASQAHASAHPVRGF